MEHTIFHLRIVHNTLVFVQSVFLSKFCWLIFMLTYFGLFLPTLSFYTKRSLLFKLLNYVGNFVAFVWFLMACERLLFCFLCLGNVQPICTSSYFKIIWNLISSSFFSFGF